MDTPPAIATSADTATLQDAVDQALDEMAAGDAASAVLLFERVLAADPTHHEATHGLIRALEDAGRIDDALTITLQLITREPEDILGHTRLSMLYQHQGKIPEAEAAATTAKLLSWKLELRAAKLTPSNSTVSSDSPMPSIAATTKLYVATSNQGKLRDFATAAEALSNHSMKSDAHPVVEILVLPGLAGIPAPPEDEPTFEGNAREKAIYYSNFLPGAIVLADDSGLEVEALNGAPGVRSARFADDTGFTIPSDDNATPDTRNNLCLLAALASVKSEDRKARYRCALAAARDGVVLAASSGSVEGRIATTPEGTGGFGYDPYFVPAGESHTMAALDPTHRMLLSHRGRALRHLLADVDWISKRSRSR